MLLKSKLHFDHNNRIYDLNFLSDELDGHDTTTFYLIPFFNGIRLRNMIGGFIEYTSTLDVAITEKNALENLLMICENDIREGITSVRFIYHLAIQIEINSPIANQPNTWGLLHIIQHISPIFINIDTFVNEQPHPTPNELNALSMEVRTFYLNNGQNIRIQKVRLVP